MTTREDGNISSRASPVIRNAEPGRLEPGQAATLFAALGDPTRLALIGRLSEASPQSLNRLLADADMTRQAISKHLGVLERAGIVSCARVGRESRYALERAQLDIAKAFLEHVSRHWDHRLERLKAFVEASPEPASD